MNVEMVLTSILQMQHACADQPRQCSNTAKYNQRWKSSLAKHSLKISKLSKPTRQPVFFYMYGINMSSIANANIAHGAIADIDLTKFQVNHSVQATGSALSNQEAYRILTYLNY